jgi:hypothetical protein
MSPSKRKDNQEFPNLKYPDFSKSQRTSRGARNAIPLKGIGKKKKGRIGTDWKDIDWTDKKIVIVSLFLGTPYLISILVTFWLGMKVIAGILLFALLCVGLIFAFLNWWNQD